MDANEIIKHVPEIAKATTAVAAAVPFTAIVKRMLGPAADEVAERWRDSVRLYRYGRQLHCLRKAEKMAVDAGFTPKAVPIKILFPLLEGASLEEDENLHTMWAALLANAASPKDADKVRPGFIAALRQMAPDEAELLNWVYKQATAAMPEEDFYRPIHEAELLEAYSALGFGGGEGNKDGARKSASANNWSFGSCLNSLEAAQLIRTRFDVVVNAPGVGEGDFYYSLTFRGFQFVSACCQPKTKA